MSCQKQHRYLDSLKNLPQAQAGESRHLCAGCALEQGLIDGLNKQHPSPQPELWGESQAGTGRHKNCIEAYGVGYQIGYQIR